MRYRNGYKAQLAAAEIFQTSIYLQRSVNSDSGRIELHCDGKLYIHEGYAWDFSSGPVLTRDSIKRASLGHDALYQLCREEKIPWGYWRECDYNYGRWLREDGCWKITVKAHLAGLKLAGGSAAHPKNRKKVHEAP